jgi:hypothetical protein
VLYLGNNVALGLIHPDKFKHIHKLTTKLLNLEKMVVIGKYLDMVILSSPLLGPSIYFTAFHPGFLLY